MELFDPIKNATLEAAAFAAVPEDFKPMYKQDGEKYVLDAANPIVKGAVAVQTNLKGLITKLRTDVDAYKGKTVDLTPLKDFGADPATIAQTISQKLAALEAAKGDAGKIREAITTEWSGKLKSQEDVAKKLESQLFEVLVVNAALNEFKAADGNADLLLPHLLKNVKAVRHPETGNVVTQVVDTDGGVRYNGAGAPMTIKDLVAEMKANATFAPGFTSKTPNGGGAKPGGAKPNPATAGRRQGELSMTQKISAGLANLGK